MADLPEQFVNRMKEMLGEEELRAFLSSYDTPIRRGLRLNPLKWNERQDDVLTCLVKHYYLRPIPWAQPYGFYYGEPAAAGSASGRGGGGTDLRGQGTGTTDCQGSADDAQMQEVRPGKSPLHEAGLYYIQEPSAMAVAALSQIAADAVSDGTASGEKILDLCAAPGGKTTMLAAGMRGQGLLIANEIDPSRAKILSQNVERMGITNAIVMNESPERLRDRFPSFFDRVMVDAPCSGEGMFRREEQAAVMWSPENTRRCAARQADILDAAAEMVQSGGLLVYSTCTFAPEEDEGGAAAFLVRHPEFTLVDLPSVLGKERMRSWGLEPGRPEWAQFRRESSDEEGNRARQSSEALISVRQEERPVCRTEALSRTIRLWPHRLEGEGHYIAVFRKEGTSLKEPVPAGWGLRLSGAGERHRQNGSAGKNGSCLRSGRRTGSDSGSERFRRADKGQTVSSGTGGTEGIAAAQMFFAGELTADLSGRLSRESGSGLVRFGDELWLMPYREKVSLWGLRVLRPGLHIGTVKKNRFEPAHALAMALREGEAVRQIRLSADAPEAEAYLRGEALPCDSWLKGWTLVTVEGISLGWGKAAGGMLRNHYPKGLRKPY